MLRRKFIRSPFLAAVLMALLAFALTGCGGSGGNPGSGSSQTSVINGTAVVPNSSGKNLGISTAYGASAASGGAFKATVPKQSLNLLSVSDTDASRVVLFGMVEPSASSTTIDTANCAAALVFLGLGGSELKGESRLSLWTSVKAHATTATLATAIDSAMQTNFYALEDGDASIKTALNNALTAQVGSLPSAPANGMSRGRDLEAATFQLISGADNGSHRATISGRQTEGFVVDNVLSPLEGVCLVYNTGYKAMDNTDHETPPEQYGAELAFAAKATSPTVPLTVASTFLAEYYDIIVLQPVFDTDPSDVFTLPGYSGEVAAWQAKLATMYRRGLIKVTAAQMFDALGAPQVDMTTAALADSVNAFSAISGDAAGIMTDAGAGTGLSNLVSRCAAVPADSEADAFSTLASLAPLLQTQAPDLAATLASKSLTSAQIQAFRGSMKILSALGSWEYSATAGEFSKNYSTGKSALRSKGSFGGTSINVLPASGTFNAGTSLLITAEVNTGVYPNPFTYEYSLSSEPGTITNAVMNDAQGHVGRTITSSSPTCYLVTGSDSVGIAELTVTFKTTDSEGQEITFEQVRRYTPNGHVEFSIMEATPSIMGPNYYDMCSGTRIPKSAPVGGTYAPVKLKFWATIEGNSINFTNGQKYVEWNFPAYSGAPSPSTKSWEIVGQTPRFLNSGTSSMAFGAYDYGDHILVVNHRGAGLISDLEYKATLTGIMRPFMEAVRSRYQLVPN